MSCWDQVMENREVRVLEWRCRVEYEDGKIIGIGGSEDVADGILSLLRDLVSVASHSDGVGHHYSSVEHATIS